MKPMFICQATGGVLLLIATLLGVCASAVGVVAQGTNQRATTQPRVEVTWVGGPTMVIRFGNLTILTDPTLGAEGFTMGDPNVLDLNKIKLHRRLTPFRGVVLEDVDLVLLSHAHEDHFDQKAQASLNRTLPIILPIADVEAFKAKGFKNLDGLKWGERRQFNAGTGRVEIIATIAQHSRDPQMAKTLGVGNGYWIEFSHDDWKWRMYWTGDTMPTSDVIQAIKSLGEPDLMAPHVGGVGTTGPLGQISMGASDVMAFADEIRPRRILPIHHSTYAFYLEPISELVAKSKGKPYRLVIVAEGTTAIYD
jgi:N-acyl-phosphatidylethanolamine-hydrolysing phospholipase D